ncbi:MAG: SMC-Scp complex subunit ScpB [Chloroflexi bacterium]|nr:SMC-Scp complex subunit ScpB [Chloroflexota bacterium]
MTDPIERTFELDLPARIEALLFVSSGPVTVAQLAAALELPGEEVSKGLDDLKRTYAERGGLRLQWSGGRVQLTTHPLAATLIEKFLGLEATSHLSRAGLEALAIIAYQQPVTRPQMDAIRGVNSDGVIKSLLSKGLIQEMGRAEGPGRPIMYATTPDFLQYFGLSSIEELPPLSPPEEEQSQILKD